MLEEKKLETIEQIDNVLLECEPVLAIGSFYGNKLHVIHSAISLCSSVINQIAGKSSSYYEEMNRVLSNRYNELVKAKSLIGIIQSLRYNIENDYLQSFEELIHGDIFEDFLEMAKYLLEETYKDPAAVIAGSSLEAHLRQLCIKNGIDVTFKNKKQEIKNKRAGRLNDDLARDSIYNKLNQKNITAWLDLRNKAAHGKYTEYDHNQVTLMVDGISFFISQFPA